jgi:NAD(P)-dependent dehydrogenase (short-subunit alcohol dehydrogenase family)
MIQEILVQLSSAVVLITGAARGIGLALAQRFARQQPSALVLSDIDTAALNDAAASCGAVPIPADVSSEVAVQSLLAQIIDRFGRLDLICSNAGVFVSGGVEVPDPEWDRLWRVNLMSHVYIARAYLPHVRRQGHGYLLLTVSAAGLLTAPGAAPYAVTKHAALSLAEWLAVTHVADGLKVSALCPEFVRTQMVLDVEGPYRDWMVNAAIPPETVAETVVNGLAAEDFLILPHPEVAEYFHRKATDYPRWLQGMRRLLDKVRA